MKSFSANIIASLFCLSYGYVRVTEKVLFTDANAKCMQTYETTAASIHSYDEFAAAVAACDISSGACWLGGEMTDIPNKIWTWEDGTTWDYSYWGEWNGVPQGVGATGEYYTCIFNDLTLKVQDCGAVETYYPICNSPIHSAAGGDVKYLTDISQILANRYIAVETGTGQWYETSCDIAVGYYTNTGGFGCVIYGGIAKGETKGCKPDTPFAIYAEAADDFGVFVVEEEGCADGLYVTSVKMGDANDYNEWPYAINRFIKASERAGAVMALQDGTNARVNAYFTSSGSSAAAQPFSIIRDATDNDDNGDWVYWFTNWTNYEIISSVWIIILFIIIGGLCKNIHAKKREIFKYKMVKNQSGSDDYLTEQEIASFM